MKTKVSVENYIACDTVPLIITLEYSARTRTVVPRRRAG